MDIEEDSDEDETEEIDEVDDGDGDDGDSSVDGGSTFTRGRGDGREEEMESMTGGKRRDPSAESRRNLALAYQSSPIRPSPLQHSVSASDVPLARSSSTRT